MPFFMNTSKTAAWEVVWNFIIHGGWFMVPILLCSLIAVAVVVFKLMTLGKALIIPSRLAHELEMIEEQLEKGQLKTLQSDVTAGETALDRLCAVAFHNAGKSQGEVQEAVQSAAREEIVKMHTGMPALEVVITIAPLLGLLGTASGLVLVFANVGQGADAARVGQGIAMALNTTVAGLAVAVPTVIAHSHFNRKIETMAARLEVLMGKVTSACHQHVYLKNR
ncbi:MAG: MotA/TolQ/ExbB proton channel family protein [Verrucomicrobiae bacterium]|nr:MotA/TolQ/ExbB proton channel family protein [Verrucomicrobiae bacterium]NNJ43153.1 MotA/TolQ/ExbB proton channel family protein [Akkermansiaceae bacterium]